MIRGFIAYTDRGWAENFQDQVSILNQKLSEFCPIHAPSGEIGSN
ncbi:defective phage integrase, truncated protein [Escherichia coli]|uniref:Defective phage integrase, truncated protein n=1 Tax=Escherichia coli TaxID=562 RepID=A0A376KVZ8_ECOLX|nr:defective phage integrase, truncated protein [Escherichia coli]